jgi:hypothetical protein
MLLKTKGMKKMWLMEVMKLRVEVQMLEMYLMKFHIWWWPKKVPDYCLAWLKH